MLIKPVIGYKVIDVQVLKTALICKIMSVLALSGVLLFCQGCFTYHVIKKVGKVNQHLDRESLVVKKDTINKCWSLNYKVKRRIRWIWYRPNDHGYVSLPTVAMTKKLRYNALDLYYGEREFESKTPLKPTKAGQLPVLYAYNHPLPENGFKNLQFVSYDGLKLSIVQIEEKKRGNVFYYSETEKYIFVKHNYVPWYGYLLKIGELPLAVAADIVTSPAQVVVCIMAYGFKKNMGH